jgi:hypothetical protein
MFVSTAARARQAWLFGASLAMRDPLVSPIDSAVVPSSEAAIFIRIHGSCESFTEKANVEIALRRAVNWS